MDRAAVVGIGMIPFGKHEDRTLVGMAAEACRLALKDAEIKPSQVDVAFFASGIAAKLFGDFTVGQNVFWEVGINRIPVINVENACTSGSTAFYLGYNMVAAGQADTVLVCGAEKMCVPVSGSSIRERPNWTHSWVWLRLRDLPTASMGHKAKKCRSSQPRPSAKAVVWVGSTSMIQFRAPLTVEEVLAAPMIVDPLTRLQCCPIADGAAALLIVSPAVAARLGRGVRVESSVLVTGNYENPQDLANWETNRRGAALAYEKAGMGPDAKNLVECHDAFTISEILHYEALGLCPPGRRGQTR